MRSFAHRHDKAYALESNHSMKRTFTPVSRADIEWLWRTVAAGVSHPTNGIFSPTSISWKINRESALFLGAGRASLLQSAHPWVATALDQHSNLRPAPLARFHNTFKVVFTTIFGTLQRHSGRRACTRFGLSPFVSKGTTGVS
jgi:hypothetical protein